MRDVHTRDWQVSEARGGCSVVQLLCSDLLLLFLLCVCVGALRKDELRQQVSSLLPVVSAILLLEFYFMLRLKRWLLSSMAPGVSCC